MVNKIQFINKDLILPVIIIGVLLLILFLWKERKTTQGKKFFISVVASFVAIITLMLIALKPAILSESEKLEMVVLTDGYKKKSLDSLQKINKNIVVKNYQNGKTILDKNIKPTQVFILGNGVESYDLWQLKNTATKYIKGIPISGVTRLKYNSQLHIGKELSVKGLYNLPEKRSKLFLEFPKGVKLDSIILNDSEKQTFNLKSKVKVAGNFLYFLVERDSLNRVVEENPLPLVVQKKESLKVLIINSFPTFDTKYLKNFLAESGHKVIVRNKLTKGKYKYEYFNTKREPFSISTNSLKGFDLLIIDAISLLNLSSKNRNTIKSVIENNGLGVFVQPDVSFFTNRNKLVSFKFLKDKSSTFKLEGIQKSIPKYNYIFKTDNLLEPIHKFGAKNYSVYKHIGKGKIASTVAQQTYSLALSGNATLFKQFWTEIINAVSKKQLVIGQFKSSSFAYKDVPFAFQLQTNIDKPKIEDIEGNKISLIQNIKELDTWFGKIYPKTTGWSQINIEKDSLSTFLFYTMNQGVHKPLRAYFTSKENKKYFNNDARNISSKVELLREINLFWLYLLFLLSVGYLWLSPKM